MTDQTTSDPSPLETIPPDPPPRPGTPESRRAALQLTLHELGAIKMSPAMTEFSNKLGRAFQTLAETLQAEASRTRFAVETALQQARSQDEEALSLMASVLGQLQKERTIRHEDLARSERLLQSLTASTQRLEGFIQSSSERLSHLIEKESATATGARRQFWDEAARFKQEIRRELRWLIRAPILGLLVLLLAMGVLWFRQQPTSSTNPARPSAVRPGAQR
jgi:Fe2+ transport system protein B